MIVLVALIAFGAMYGVLQAIHMANTSIKTESVAVKNIGSDIVATGTIHSQNEAILHFQAGGKLTYLPLKAGDPVYTGETIAQLDQYAMQQALTQALNNYRSTRDTFDQTQQNSQNGVLNNTSLSGLNQSGAGLGTYGVDNGTTNYINDVAKRIVDQNQANLDNSVINVQLANYALQMSSLTSPINGILTNEDVTVAGQNITPTTSFSVADPSRLVFKANVAASDIDFVSVGATAKVSISGQKNSFTGTVIKIYPQKMTLSSGQEVYQVDIQSDGVQTNAKLGQNGSVLIQSNADMSSVTVPTWTILGHNHIWVEENNQPVLKTVTIGKVHGDTTEVLSGLESNDRVITNPTSIANQKYQVL